MTSEADRLRIGKGNNVVKLSQTIRPASTYIASQAPYDWGHYHFIRVSNNPAPWDRSERIKVKKSYIELAALALGLATIAGAGWAMWG
jgi:hypothetical protein